MKPIKSNRFLVAVTLSMAIISLPIGQSDASATANAPLVAAVQANNPIPCYTTGIFRKKTDCTLQKLYERVLNGNNRDILSAHLYLAERTNKTYKPMYISTYEVALKRPTCLNAMRSQMLIILPTLGKNVEAAQMFWKYIDAVNLAFDMVNLGKVSNEVTRLLVQEGSKAAGKELSKQVVLAQLPDQGAITSLAKSLAGALASYKISSYIQNDYLLAIYNIDGCV